MDMDTHGVHKWLVQLVMLAVKWYGEIKGRKHLILVLDVLAKREDLIMLEIKDEFAKVY